MSCRARIPAPFSPSSQTDVREMKMQIRFSGGLCISCSGNQIHQERIIRSSDLLDDSNEKEHGR